MTPKAGTASSPPDPPLRRLLPSEPSRWHSYPAAEPSASSSTPKRRQIAAACDACRQRKTKCSGDRPSCSTCITRETKCRYDTATAETRPQATKRKYAELQLHKADLERVYHALRSRPDADAEGIYQRIRRGDDVNVIARHIKFGDLLVQIALEPETRYRYEFPLAQDMPAHLLGSWNPYLDSLVYEWASTAPPPESNASAASTQAAAAALSPTTVETYAPYMTPYHATEVTHHQLDSAEPSRWTSVCSDNTLMRELLAAYFRQEHDWYTCIQKDYFLEDMAGMKLDFCSPLLVNTLLAIACHCYRPLANRAEYWNPQTLGYRFLAEARRLWELELGSPKLTTIHASLLLNLVNNISGADKVGWPYTIRAIHEANAIGLFRREEAAADDRLQRGRDFTAWAVFCWQSFVSFLFFKVPLLRQPPNCALPCPQENPDWYGELYLKYPLNQRLYPAQFGEIFKAKAAFHVILNELSLRQFTDEPRLNTGLSDAEVAEYYMRFRDWFENLPESLSPRKAVLPGHLKLHMQYYHVLFSLLKSFTDAEAGEKHPPDIAAQLFGTPPHELCLQAKACSETLFRVYYLRHGFEYLDISLLAFVPPLIFMTIEDVEASRDRSAPDLVARQSTAVLLSKAIHEQGKSYYLAQVLFELVRGRMPAEDFELVRRFADVEEPGEAPGDKHAGEVQSDWPVDTVGLTDNPDEYRLSLVLRQQRREAPLRSATSASESETSY